MRVPVVVTTEGGDNTGRLITLVMRYDSGPSGDFRVESEPPGPNTDEAFEASIRAATTWASRQARHPQHGGVTWHIEDVDGSPVQQITGESAGAAFAVGLSLLLGLTQRTRWRRQDTRTVVSATVDASGRLGPVRDLTEKAKAVGSVQRRFVVAPEGYDAASSGRSRRQPTVVRAPRAADAAAASVLARTWRTPLAAVVALALLILGSWAYDSRERDAAAARSAAIDRLAAASRGELGDAPDAAAADALRAYGTDPTDPVAAQALLTASYSDPRLTSVVTTDSARTVSFSPDGRTLVIGSGSDIAAYSADGQRLLARLSPHGGTITALRFDPGGARLVVGTEQGLIYSSNRLGHGTGWTPPRLVHRAAGPLLALAVSARRLAWATSSSGLETQLLPPQGSVVRLRGPDASVTSLAFAGPDLLVVGRLAAYHEPSLLTVGADRRGTGRTLLTRNSANDLLSNGISALAVTDDGKRVITGGIDERVRTWSTKTLRQTSEYRVTGSICTLSITEDGDTAVVATRSFPTRPVDTSSGDAKVRLLDLADHAKPLGTPLAENSSAMTPQLAINPRTARTAVVLAAGSGRTRVTLWAAPDHPRDRVMGVVRDPVHADSVLVLFADGGLARVNARTGARITLLRTAKGRQGYTVALSQDGHVLALSDSTSTITLYAYPALRRLGGPLHGATPIPVLAFSPDGTTLATGDEYGTVQLWDTGSHRLRHSRRDPGKVWVGSLTWNTTGNRLLVGHRDGNAEILDGPTGRVISHRSFGTGTQQAEGIGDAAAAVAYRDGFLIGFGDGRIARYSVRLTLLGTFVDRHNGNVLDDALSPDGTYLLSLGVDSTARLSLVPAGTPLVEVASTREAVTQQLFYDGAYQFGDFTSSGRYAVLGGTQGNVQVIAVRGRPLLARACSLLDHRTAPRSALRECP
ncbi:hypothetical protein ACWEN3_16850 [Streptomyces sp. NPDC004561]